MVKVRIVVLCHFNTFFEEGCALVIIVVKGRLCICLRLGILRLDIFNLLLRDPFFEETFDGRLDVLLI